jgi:hypothetical protein
MKTLLHLWAVQLVIAADARLLAVRRGLSDVRNVWRPRRLLHLGVAQRTQIALEASVTEVWRRAANEGMCFGQAHVDAKRV